MPKTDGSDSKRRKQKPEITIVPAGDLDDIAAQAIFNGPEYECLRWLKQNRPSP